MGEYGGVSSHLPKLLQSQRGGWEETSGSTAVGTTAAAPSVHRPKHGVLVLALPTATVLALPLDP